MKLFVMVGHLGKDSGAAIAPGEEPYNGDNVCYPHQDEVWANLQQAYGFMLGSVLDPADNLKVVFVSPNGVCEKLIFPVLDYEGNFSLQARADLANHHDAYVVEIHNNANTNPSISGAEMYCHAGTEAGAWASHILAELQKSGIKTRSIMGGDKLYMVRNCKRACLITEAGYVSHRESARKLDVDMDGYNEQVGAVMWKGFKRAWLA